MSEPHMLMIDCVGLASNAVVEHARETAKAGLSLENHKEKREQLIQRLVAMMKSSSGGSDSSSSGGIPSASGQMTFGHLTLRGLYTEYSSTEWNTDVLYEIE